MKGRKTGGRKPGSKNKATLEREAKAAIDQARAARVELAKDSLVRYQGVAEGATGRFRQLVETVEGNTAANWKLFGEWFDRMLHCAEAAAKYQSPPIKAVDAPAPPPDPRELEANSRKRFGLRVFDGGRALTAS